MSDNNIGLVFQNMGKYVTSIQYHEKALTIRVKILGPHHIAVAGTLINISTCFQYQGEYNKAIDYILQASRIYEKSFGLEHPYVGVCANNLGVCYKQKSDYNKAIEHFEMAYAFNVKKFRRDHPDIASCLNNLGVCYRNKGDYANAIAYYHKALDIRKRTLDDEHPDVALSLANIGSIYELIEEYDKAIEYFQQTLAIRLKTLGEDHQDVAVVYDNMGLAYKNKFEFDKSIEYHQKALTIRSNLPDGENLHLAYSLHNIASVYEEKGDNNRAISFYQKALELRLKTLGLEQPEIVTTYYNLGNIYLSNMAFEQAIASYLNALKACRYSPGNFKDVNSVEGLLNTLNVLSRAFKIRYLITQDTSFLHASDRYIREALDVIEYQNLTFNTEESKSFWQSRNQEIYEQAIEIGLLKDNMDHNGRTYENLFKLAEKSKATQLQAQLKNADALAFSGIPDSMTQKEYQLRIDLNWRGKQRQALLDNSKTETDSTVLRLSSILFDLRQQYDTLKKYFEKNYSEYYRLKYELRPVPLQYVQDSLLQLGQSLLEYFVGDSSIYLFLVQPKNYKVIEIKKDSAFEQWVENLTSNGIYGYYAKKGVPKGKSINNFGTAAFQLYETLIAPVKAQLPKGEKLIIIPDGILGYVPFEALLAERPPRPDAIAKYKYLIQDHQISYCYSATLLKEMRNKKHRQEPTQKLLAMAPFFLGNADTLLSQVDTTELIGGITLRDTLTGLPNSGEEVARIQKILKGQALYGKAATLAQFQKLAAQARILHLSTHGKADDRLGDYAYLAFGMPNADGTFAKLYARDLYNLSLNADLVVLSACETGIGKLQRGEGVVSLARAFAYAGAKSIVTTLWKVSDEHSKNLMSSFYKYLSKGKDKEEALRLAKLEFLQKNEKKTELLHPFFWASFIGIGDMRRLENIK